MTATSTRRRAAFNTLTVANVRKLTKDSVEVTFAVPDELVADYDYLPGQYVALRATIDGQEVRRSYSICAEPTPGEIKVAIKRDFGGLFSNWANDTLAAGQQIDVMNPQGAFVSKSNITGLNDPQKVADDAQASDGEHMVAFAAGSGITPIISIARTVLKASPTSTFDLVYANKSAMDVMFAEEIGDLKDRYPTRFAVHHVLSREQRINPMMSGRIDDERLNALLDHVIQVDRADEWFLCGPFELVQLCRDTLAERGVKEENVRFELFTTGKPENPAGQQGRAVEADPTGANYAISFNLDGTSSSVDSPISANETILNAALRVRADVPFACAGGVCGTCRAKVVSGEVEMDENYALEKEEVEAGYILTCQTRPCSDAVTVDFDA